MENTEKFIYIARDYQEILEGGASRDKAFFDFIQNKHYDIWKIYSKNKILNRLKILFKLFFQKNKVVFLHMSSYLSIFPPKIYSNKFMSVFLKVFFWYITLRNRVIIDINDLQYEQAIDLELNCNLKKTLKTQKILLNLKNCEYIFASEMMREYAELNYMKKIQKNYVCINGAIDTKLTEKKKIIKRKKIRFIYAGTLNRGRSIEEMINYFEKSNINGYLILAGTEGEWLKDEKYKKIYYIGSLTEEKAMLLTKKCDVGVIPYSEEKLYYNICYPTKVSFYLIAGIPILMENLKESLRHIDKKNLFIEKKENWKNKIENINLEEIEQKKKLIMKLKENFLWKNLLRTLFKEIVK